MGPGAEAEGIAEGVAHSGCCVALGSCAASEDESRGLAQRGSCCVALGHSVVVSGAEAEGIAERGCCVAVGHSVVVSGAEAEGIVAGSEGRG